jgi:Fic family protein
VRQIHHLVLTRIDDEEEAGQYRRVQVYIAGADHRPPEAWQVPQLMADWGDWLNGPAQDLHPVVRAALAHRRLVMNLLLMRDGYPPTIIENAHRRQYYRVLARADTASQRSDEEPLVNFVGRAAERSLTLYLEACTPRSEPPAPEDEWLPCARQ